jgi:hypothetical protein
MIVSLLVLQAAAVAVSPVTRSKYEPFRRCLIEQARALPETGASDEALLEQARSKCLVANLSAGSAALFAEIAAGATKEQAIDRIAALREEVEHEALASRHPGGAVSASSPEAARQASLVITGEIAPAVFPYLQCLRKNGVASVAPCRAARAKAAKDSDRLLKRAGRGKAGRAAYIESVLASVDRFHAATSVPPPSLPSTE